MLSALLTLQMIRRYNELSPFGRPRHNEFNLRGVVTFGFSMLALLFIAIYTRCPPAALHSISDG